MSEGEEGIGVGGIGPIILIVIATLALLFLMYGTAWPATREAFTNIVGEKGELKEKFDKAFREKEVNLEKERKDVEEISAFFTKSFDVKDDDCISRIDLSSIRDKNFDLKINGNRKSLVNKDSLREYSLNVKNTISFLRNGIKDSSFILAERFSRIDDQSFSEHIYMNGNTVYFMDDLTAADFSDVYSPVFAKKKCGEEKAEIEKLKLIAVEGISDEIEKGFDKESSDMILHLWYVHASGDFNDVKRKLNIVYWDKLRDHVVQYYNSKFSDVDCWRYIIYLYLEDLSKPRISSKSDDFFGGYVPSEGGFERLKVDVREDEPKDPRKIAEITLLVSNSDECRKV